MSAPATFMQKVFTYIFLMCIAFLIGFIPMWLNSLKCSRNLSAAQHQLTRATLQNDLASSVIEARRGDYESARQAVSTFYNSLQVESDKEENSAFSQDQRERIKEIFSKRDETITLIARNDPASADRLSDLYVLCRDILKW